MKLSAGTPTTWLTPEVDQRLRHWADLATGEMSALGTVEPTQGGFVVTKVFLPRQACGAAETELDQTAVAQLLTELDAAGEDLSKLRLWAHSHADFNCFWSATDESTVRRLANGDWTLALVFNKAGERRCRLDVWHPVHVTLDSLPVGVVHEDLGLREDCERLFRDRVTEVPALPLLMTSTARLSHLSKVKPLGRLDVLELSELHGRHPAFDWGELESLLDPRLDDERGSDVGP